MEDLDEISSLTPSQPGTLPGLGFGQVVLIPEYWEVLAVVSAHISSLWLGLKPPKGVIPCFWPCLAKDLCWRHEVVQKQGLKKGQKDKLLAFSF